ncbi:WcbI family polysaccharide biosynthesis putative acetyltransferase [Asticcacaulis sp. EMRT-3]|uniref:WcbI family polysaccharide biosynthesis putative acetyltransferase n=1 Tax=Asticcacaulis sp. EMRT-3 TaxID=3040349 RepID=UPI0024AF1462|nr:WcbI family polysaccharide biosynthesis putative acetyltransferase [Asticcacaulis sp. EMRT-3]MDI7776360.1 WcbI family polysaccharide biosynthesis putative acetyltransferase [Asticcacaulis sp. EMRT-3]
MFLKKKLKIAIIGGCQSAGLREATLSLVPRCEVTCWHAGVHPDSPEQIFGKLRAFDLIISQISPGHGLEILEMDSLRREFKSVHFMPTAVFAGFHPDMTYIMDHEGLLSAVHSDFHSRIAVAAYLLGLSPEKTLKLYNPLVFAELGYFEDFPAARLVFEQNLQDGGLNTDGLFDSCIRDVGAFMYMANHPHIQVLTRMCRDLYIRLGLIGKKTALPAVRKDHLAESFTWPVYPALAQRAGVTGSMNFQRPAWMTPQGEAREFPMQTYLRDLHGFYTTVPRHRLESGTVTPVRDKLAELIL